MYVRVCVRATVDRGVFLLTAVINSEHPWLGTKLLLNSLTFCVIASGRFAEVVQGSNGIRLENTITISHIKGILFETLISSGEVKGSEHYFYVYTL